MTVFSLPQKLSPSSIDRYRACPQRFLWQDVERRPLDQRPSPELAVGNAVHRVLELLFQLPVFDRNFNSADRLLRSVWPEFRKPGTFSSRDAEAAAGRDALAMLERFTVAFDMAIEPLKLEQWVSLQLKNGLKVSTRIDRIDRVPGGGLHVIDYKTGRHQMDQADMSTDTQLMISLLAVEHAAGREVERLSLIYLRSGETICWEPEREDVETVGRRLTTLIKDIYTDAEFAPAPGPLCGWCPYVLQCEARPEVDLEEFLPVENLPF